MDAKNRKREDVLESDFDGWDKGIRLVRGAALKGCLNLLKQNGVRGLGVVSAMTALVIMTYVVLVLSGLDQSMKVLCIGMIVTAILIIAVMTQFSKGEKHATAHEEDGDDPAEPGGDFRDKGPVGSPPGSNGVPVNGRDDQPGTGSVRDADQGVSGGSRRPRKKKGR